MGRLGQQLVRNDRKALIEALTRAYADEWYAHYNYFFVSKTISGPDSPAVSQVLRRKSDRALIHAERLAERIIALGGAPVPKLTDLSKDATDKPFKLPKNVRDIDGALKAVLDAERTSIRTYRALSEKIREKDSVTQALAVELFREAVEGEEEIERLLGEPAPEMDGR
ncbi:MAG: ferritin-like domain-containing protein [Candidatus Manganitrophus sp.]|nr:ferritin-like domain-containing protein [Candidatus Manganitrophus sp.]